MKKIVLLTLATALVATAAAEGYQVNTLSAKQLGMGHVGVSQKLNSESLWFNPAAASYQESKFSASVGVTGIASVAKATQLNDYDDSTYEYTEESDNKLSTPLYFNANYKVNDKLTVGLLFNTPFGSSMNWGDNWSGAHLIQEINLQAYNAQPTISYKFLKGKLSVGAGLMMMWGNFDLSRSMFPVSDATNTILNAYYNGGDDFGIGDNPAVSATLGGDSKLAFGVNIGAFYDISEKWSIGASYRSKVKMKVEEGTASVDYFSDDVEGALSSMFGGMEMGTFSASLPLPSTFSLGATFRPTERWELTAEFQWVQWSAYDSLAVEFNEVALAAYNQDLEKNYSNTMITRIGAQYRLLKGLAVRVGFYVDESPVASDYFNPETPSMTKVGYTCGASLMPFANKNISIDLAYAHIGTADPERTGTYKYTNSLTSASEPFSRNYEVNANVFSFGVSMAF